MKCIGSWKAPKNAELFQSALTCVHENAHGRCGGYREACDDCAALFESSGGGRRYFGCASHAGDPRAIHLGNVMNSTLVEDTIKDIKKGSAHVIVYDIIYIILYIYNYAYYIYNYADGEGSFP
jgi:hypothetical protein